MPDTKSPVMHTGQQEIKPTEKIIHTMNVMHYLNHGWSVIPIRLSTKTPALPAWERYQRDCPSAEEVRRWFSQARRNVAIVTGAVSGLVVVDVDGPEGERSLSGRFLPPTPTAITGKGRHLYFAHPGWFVKKRVRVLPQVDIIGDGGYVVAPPSVHPSGRRYTWAEGLSPWDLEPAPCPPWLLELLQASREEKDLHTPVDWRRLIHEGVPEGRRNDSITRLAGRFLRLDVDPYDVLDFLLWWSQKRCRPPLPEEEMVRTVNSIAGRERRRRGGGAA